MDQKGNWNLKFNRGKLIAVKEIINNASNINGCGNTMP